MSKYTVILIIVLLSFQSSYAQGNNIWYFGRKAGLNFNSSVPVVLYNSMMNADEGASSICDDNGNILFYTNGVTVYNRKHEVMLNGDGLAGNISAVQSAIIVPLPGSPDLYFIFTTDAVENNFVNGYTYSMVDMARDNGFGEVISKNSLLWGSCTERMAAVRHADGVSVWLITNDNNSNTFRSWLIDCSGIHLTPVVSSVGIVLNTHRLVNTGSIKVSPDGTQLCQTWFPDDAGLITLFSFLILTG